MSLRNLFEKPAVIDNTKQELNEIYNSNEINVSNAILKHKIIPNINFENPANFVRFGSAEEYYKNSFNYIIDHFPYDGTKQDEINWLNNATYLDKYIYSNIHPKYVGCLKFNNFNDYTFTTSSYASYYKSEEENIIKIFGGLNKTIEFDEEYNDSNLRIDHDEGLTISFWYKSEESPDEEMEIIFEEEPAPIYNKTIFHFVSDSVINSTTDSNLNIYSYEKYQLIGFEFYVDDTYVNYIELPLTDSDWHHYSCTLKYDISEQEYIFKVYKDGLRMNTTYDSFNNNMNVTGNYSTFLTGTIGCYTLIDDTSFGTIDEYGYGQCYGSKLDEFKLFSRVLSEEEINTKYYAREYNTINDSENKNKLQLYFKFNECVIGNDQVDNIVTDYSGRKSNCRINNYDNNREYESALEESGFIEFQEPCRNVLNTEVSDLINRYTLLGRSYDAQNSHTLFNNFPNWIKEEDYEANNNLFILCQIIASQLDEIYLQIKNINKIFNIDYNSIGIESEELLSYILGSYGIDVKDILSEISFDEWNLVKNDEFNYSNTLQKVKSVIYRNIYNNLININKSKGTKESIRMLFRTFGINEELYTINLYADNDTIKPSETNEILNVSKKCIDFNNHINGTIHINRNNFLTGSNISVLTDSNVAEYGTAYTFETQFKFPKAYSEYDKNYVYYPQSFLTSSLFGINSLTNPFVDYTNGSLSINVSVGRSNRYSEDGTFMLFCSSSVGSATIHSENKKIFNGNRWMFTLEMQPSDKLSINSTVYNTNSQYECILNCFDLDNINNTIILTSSISLESYSENKIYYIGANRQNTTGSIQTSSIGDCYYFRGWHDLLSDTDKISHTNNLLNFGTSTPSQNITISTFYSSSYVPRIDSLIFNWDFELVSGTDNSGEFTVHDRSKPSSYKFNRNYPGIYGHNLCNINSGSVLGFPSLDTTIVKTDYISVFKNDKIDNIISNKVNILTEDDLYFSRLKKPVRTTLTLEKNFTDSLNNEILKYFSDMTQIINCFGLPYEKYRDSYKNLDNLKTLFFEKIDNNLINYNKFNSFYKWIDYSIFYLVQQIIPFGNNSGLFGNFIESHILERNKITIPLIYTKTDRQDLTFELSIPNYTDINWVPSLIGQQLINFDWTPNTIPSRIIE